MGWTRRLTNPRFLFVLTLLLMAEPALAHNPSGAGAILGYLLLSPVVMLVLIAIGISRAKTALGPRITVWDQCAIPFLMILGSLIAMVATFKTLALASQVMSFSFLLFFIYLGIHVWAALTVSSVYCSIRKQKADAPNQEAALTAAERECPRCHQLISASPFCEICGLDLRQDRPPIVLPDREGEA